MKKILLIVCFILLSCIQVLALNSYDRYGNRTGSYRSNSRGVTTQYDKYGNKVGSYRTNNSGTNAYDKYGNKTGSFR